MTQAASRSPAGPAHPAARSRHLPSGYAPRPVRRHRPQHCGWKPGVCRSRRPSRWRLPLDARTALVSIDTVRAALGMDAEAVCQQVELGRLRWVWDISTHKPGCHRVGAGSVRELRFWVGELLAPQLAHQLARPEAIALMLGPGHRPWRASEVVHRLLCSRSVVKRLVDTGELAGSLRQHTCWITRRSLERFLGRRLLR
jgi:hypothetical protein